MIWLVITANVHIRHFERMLHVICVFGLDAVDVKDRISPHTTKPPLGKANTVERVSDEDSCQSGHLPSLNRVFAVRFVGNSGTTVVSAGLRKLSN